MMDSETSEKINVEDFAQAHNEASHVRVFGLRRKFPEFWAAQID